MAISSGLFLGEDCPGSASQVVCVSFQPSLQGVGLRPLKAEVSGLQGPMSLPVHWPLLGPLSTVPSDLEPLTEAWVPNLCLLRLGSYPGSPGSF